MPLKLYHGPGDDRFDLTYTDRDMLSYVSTDDTF